MIKQVIVDTTGGKVVGPVIPVEVMTASQAAGMPVEGKLLRVVQVTDADIAAGRAKVVGGRPIPVVVGTAGLDSVGGPIQQVYVVSGSLDPSMIYTNKVLALNPIAYWPMAESSGTVMLDASGNGRNGTYTAVTLAQTGIGDGRTSASFDGSTSLGNAFTAGLQGAFNPAEGTSAIWCKVSAAGVWTDGVQRFASLFGVNLSSNYAGIYKRTVSNSFENDYFAGGVAKAVAFTQSPTAWFHIAMTWSVAADQVKFYTNGVQQGATLTGLGTWSGALASTRCVIGAGSTAPATVWSGTLAHAVVFASALSPTNIAALASLT